MKKDRYTIGGIRKKDRYSRQDLKSFIDTLTDCYKTFPTLDDGTYGLDATYDIWEYLEDEATDVFVIQNKLANEDE